MTDVTGFRIRLRARTAKALTTDATSLLATIAGKAVTIKSQTRDEPLNVAKWIVLQVRGFATTEEAQLFGGRLRSILQVAALASHIGVDVGEDKATTSISEDFARAIGLIEAHQRIAPNVHGLSVLPDDDDTRFPIVNAEARVTADPQQLLSALHELGANEHTCVGTVENAVRLLNLSLMTQEPLAQMVLAFSAIEEIGQNEQWSPSQEKLIRSLATVAARSTEVTPDERAEVVAAIRKGLHRLSLRQGVMRLLSRLDLDGARKEWDRLYGLRSGLFHGTARLSDSEVSEAALATFKLCARIVFAILAKEGVRVPSIASTHFGI